MTIAAHAAIWVAIGRLVVQAGRAEIAIKLARRACQPPSGGSAGNPHRLLEGAAHRRRLAEMMAEAGETFAQ